MFQMPPATSKTPTPLAPIPKTSIQQRSPLFARTQKTLTVSVDSGSESDVIGARPRRVRQVENLSDDDSDILPSPKKRNKRRSEAHRPSDTDEDPEPIDVDEVRQSQGLEEVLEDVKDLKGTGESSSNKSTPWRMTKMKQNCDHLGLGAFQVLKESKMHGRSSWRS